MPTVVLLSEIHPLVGDRPAFHPRQQLHQWYPQIHARLHNDHPRSEGVAQDLRWIAAQCNRQEQLLLVREWTYPDWLAIPSRCFHSRLRQALPTDFFQGQIISIRHPLDNWLSFDASGFSRKVGAQAFFEGYLKFIQEIRSGADSLLIDYDSLVRDPVGNLSRLSEYLGIPCKPDILEQAPAYRGITGDSGRSGGKIAPRQRRSIDPDQLKLLHDLEVFHQCIERHRATCALLAD